MKNFLLSISLIFAFEGVSFANTSGITCSMEPVSLNGSIERISLCYTRHISATPGGTDVFENLVLANSRKTLVVPLGADGKGYITVGEGNALCSMLVPSRKPFGKVLKYGRGASSASAHNNQSEIKYYATVGLNPTGVFTGFELALYNNQPLIEHLQCL